MDPYITIFARRGLIAGNGSASLPAASYAALPIQGDILLDVVEKLSLKDIGALMLTNRATFELIRSYERSIVLAKLRRAIKDPLFWPVDDVFLSSTYISARRIELPPASFFAVQEVEVRARRIDRLWGAASPLLESLDRLEPFRDHADGPRQRLLDGLRDACAVVDRIADSAAEAAAPRALIAIKMHRAQQAFIRGLSALRLALVTLLTSLAGMAYMAVHSGLRSDPEAFERRAAFEETVLRHGTVAMEALLFPSPPSSAASAARTHFHHHDRSYPPCLECQRRWAPAPAPAPAPASAPTQARAPGRSGNNNNSNNNNNTVTIRRIGSPSKPPRARGAAARHYAHEVDAALAALREYESGNAEQGPQDHDNPLVVPHSLLSTLLGAFPEEQVLREREERLAAEEEEEEEDYEEDDEEYEGSEDDDEDDDEDEDDEVENVRDLLILDWMYEESGGF